MRFQIFIKKIMVSIISLIVFGVSFFCGASGNGNGVNGGSVSISSLTITPASFSIIPGDSVQLKATAQYSDGSSKDLTPLVTWGSPSNPGIVTIGGSGMITGQILGSVDITATEPDSGWEAMATINVVSAYNAEGSGTPVSLTYRGNTPYNGTVDNTESRYVINGLPSGNYGLTISGMIDNVDASLFSDPNFSANITTSSNAGTANEYIQLTGGATLYLSISGINTSAGASFVISIAPLSEGNISIANGSYNGTVDTSSSSYQIPNTVAGAYYKIDLANLSDDVDMYVFGEVQLNTLLCAPRVVGTVSESCYVKAVSATTMIIISGLKTGIGAEYTLTVTRPASEGDSLNPVQLAFGTAVLPYAGEVGDVGTGLFNSFYQITGLTQNTTYIISVTGSTGDIDLDTYRVDFAVGNRICMAANTGNQEYCMVTTGAGETFLNVKVIDLNASDGEWYTLNVEPITTLAYTGGLPITSSVGKKEKYYLVTGLTSGTNYALMLDLMTDNGDLFVLQDAGQSSLSVLCSSQRTGVIAEGCHFAGPVSTQAIVRISGLRSTAGTSFKLKAQTAWVVNPAVNYATDLPAAGFIDNTAPMVYTVTNMGGVLKNFRFQLFGSDSNPELAVYSDAGLTTLLCSAGATAPYNEPTKSCTGASSAGTLYVKVFSNSAAISKYYLQITETSPNLTVTLDDVYKDPSIGGICWQYTVTNSGDGAVENLSWFYLDFWANSTTAPVDISLGQAELMTLIYQLAPGNSYTATFYSKALADTTGTAYVSVDSNNQLNESNENDNLSNPFSW